MHRTIFPVVPHFRRPYTYIEIDIQNTAEIRIVELTDCCHGLHSDLLRAVAVMQAGFQYTKSLFQIHCVFRIVIAILRFHRLSSSGIFLRLLRYVFWTQNITEPFPKLVQHTHLSLLFVFPSFPAL